VLEARKYWIEFCFTPLSIWVGKIAAPLCLLRLFVTRRDEETYSLSLLFGATVQYVVFKSGADVHIFWSIYFAPYFALALAQLVHASGSVSGWIVGRFAPARRKPTVAWVALGLGLLPVLAMTHDGVASLWVWRRTGGRYNDNGSLIRSHIDMLQVLEQVVLPQTTRGMTMDTSPSANWGWEHQWKWQGPDHGEAIPASNDRGAVTHPFWIGRGSGMMSEAQRKVIGAAHVRIYGDTWLVDQREAQGPLDAYAVQEREPNLFEWLFIDGIEPRRTVSAQPDAWLTWEYRTHLGQQAFAPTAVPVTLDEIRIAHNLAVERGDKAAVEQWREKIDAQIDRTVQTRFDSWVNLIGVHLVGGVQPRIESWFEVTATPAGEAEFQVHSVVEARGRFSLIPPDKTSRSMAYAPSLPTKVWKPGYVYKTVAVLNHRIGREVYEGHWSARDGSNAPRRLDHQPETTLLVLE